MTDDPARAQPAAGITPSNDECQLLSILSRICERGTLSCAIHHAFIPVAQGKALAAHLAAVEAENTRLREELRDDALSASYVRLRTLLTPWGALDTAFGGSDRFDKTEAALKAALAERQTAEAEAARLRTQLEESCPHCQLPRELPAKCTDELNEILEKSVADTWDVFGHGYSLGRQMGKESAEVEAARLREERDRLGEQLEAERETTRKQRHEMKELVEDRAVDRLCASAAKSELARLRAGIAGLLGETPTP